MAPATVATVRRFNRAVGETIGITSDRFLGRKRPPGESRLLWEIGETGADVVALRQRLALDSGYVSRVLQSLARRGLVRIGVKRTDRRVRRATLTRSGRAERRFLDRQSNAVAARVLERLTVRQRQRLVSAMSDVERLLRISAVRFVVVDPRSPDAQFCLREYFQELDRRFDAGFDPARSIPADPDELRRPAGMLVLAYVRDSPVACGALKFHARAPAELKRMWVAPDFRGFGVAERLLAELERRATRAGARRVRLETNAALREAIALYRRCGYVEVAPFNDEPYAHHWFEKRLRDKTSSIEIPRPNRVSIAPIAAKPHDT